MRKWSFIIGIILLFIGSFLVYSGFNTYFFYHGGFAVMGGGIAQSGAALAVMGVGYFVIPGIGFILLAVEERALTLGLLVLHIATFPIYFGLRLLQIYTNVREYVQMGTDILYFGSFLAVLGTITIILTGASKHGIKKFSIGKSI